MMASIAEAPERAEGKMAVLPPLLSLDLFNHTRAAFQQTELVEQAATYARAVLDDYAQADRSPETRLRAMHAFLVRKQTLRAHGEASDIAAMERSGLIRTVLDERNRPLSAGRIPELIASELAREIAVALDERMGSEEADAGAAAWLVRTTSVLPLGDVIGAQALVDLGQHRSGISLAFLNALLDRRPISRTMKPGSKAIAWVPSVGRVNLSVRDDGTTVLDHPGWPETIEIAPEEGGQTYADLDAWMILSHLASVRIAAVGDDRNSPIGLVDPAILAHIGTSPLPLRRPSAEFEDSGMHTHDLPGGVSLVCRDDGIIEPVAFSLLRFFEREGENADDWLEDVLEGGSAPLLNRIGLALRQLSELNSTGQRARWARAQLAPVNAALDRAIAAERLRGDHNPTLIGGSAVSVDGR
jgi:hypothetical protein